MVPAPGLFSMMTDAPRSFAISCASVRAITSVPPPGAKGTTILTIRSGYDARAGPAEMAAGNNAATANNSVALKFRGDIGAILVRGHFHTGNTTSRAMRRTTNRYDGRRRMPPWTPALAID